MVTFPVHVRPGNAVTNDCNSMPRYGGPKLDLSFSATVTIAKAPWAFIDQDDDDSDSRISSTISVMYKRKPASVPET